MRTDVKIKEAKTSALSSSRGGQSRIIEKTKFT